uniref:TIL domain-containing protein n=2 Tax=Parascaris univalens TaxID=6257 RepID=A0A915BYB1_PARUN
CTVSNLQHLLIMWSIFALLVLLAPIVQSANVVCRRNEVWTECTGCELRCTDNENTPCPLMCNPPSCECMASRGFRRDYWGNCIPRYQCPRRPGFWGRK